MMIRKISRKIEEEHEEVHQLKRNQDDGES